MNNFKDNEYIFVCFTLRKDRSTNFALRTLLFQTFLRYTDHSPIKKLGLYLEL